MSHAVRPFKQPSSSTNKSSSGQEYDDDARPYVIVGDIGKGSFATVYKGYHEDTRQIVAIKAVQRSNLSTKLFENLQSEIQILKSLSHRHITKLIDIVRAEKNIYLIMEFCAGGDLTNYIKKRGRVEGLEYVPSPGMPPQYYPHPRSGGLDEVAVRSFLRQLARALKFLRHRNLIHRDIKPQNLLLNPASQQELERGHPLGVPILKVADFGFARSLPNQVMAETLCGSPLYMAPEILRYEKYDAKADLWSVGAVLYEMAVGKAPFRAQNHIELLRKIESSKGVRFPDEDGPSAGAPTGAHGGTQGANGGTQANGAGAAGGSRDLPVPEDIKQLIRMLLKRNPVERASFEDFFGSVALAKSKFPRPQQSLSPSASGTASASAGVGTSADGVEGADRGRARGRERDPDLMWHGGRPPTPEHHKIIPPEVLDPNAMIPPSRFNFRRAGGAAPGVDGQAGPSHRRTSTDGRSPASAHNNHLIAPSPSPSASPSSRHSPEGDASANGRATNAHTGGGRRTKRLSTEGSFIPGETEEDGNLRREYVLVEDRKAVEFGRAVDEISSQPRRPLYDRKTTLNNNNEYDTPTAPSPISATATSPRTIPGRTPTTPSTPSTANTNTFPPPPSSTPIPVIPAPPPLSSSPSSMAHRAAANALNRALSIAKKNLNLFGHSHSSSGAGSRQSSHSRGDSGQGQNGVTMGAPEPSPSPGPATRAVYSPSARPQILSAGSGDGESERDPLEEELLASLEELAQKTDVLTHWADEMYEYVKAIPQKPLPDPSKFHKSQHETEKQARKRKNADMEAEYNAVTCVAVYMLLMGFSQKGIDKLRTFQEHMRMRYPDGEYAVSEGFDEALNWFKDHYFKCYERAALVKTWLPVTYDGPKSWLDQLVYDRALLLSRTAARKELLDQMRTPDECEKLYEESLWCLYALQDDLLQTGNPFMDEDRETIATWIKRTKLRLVRCRARMAMNHRDRVNDARADQNLADVARIPAPWDVKPPAASAAVPSPKGSPRVGGGGVKLP